ncbi:MAG TPA: polyamine aminopropyltransferase [Syntrophomonadaceae bacterium]|nr:polyamine aminopropyltransferase [Syntrophomonadaceae bacterium]
MELWISELQTPNLKISCRTSQTLRNEKTPFQELAVVVTETFGRMLLLDGAIQTTEKDEFVYHEMITQVPINSHPHPDHVVIIGGGDGGALRDVVKNPAVKKGTLVEIDQRVIQASQDFFPELSCSFTHPKSEVLVADGLAFMKEHKNSFDIVIVDSTDPVGPAVQLFGQAFYQDVFDALKEDGMLVVQSESPFLNSDIIKMAYGGISNVFPLTRLYLANVPTYPSGLWSFTVGSKKYDPQMVLRTDELDWKYYTPEIHRAAFQLPPFAKKIIE